MIHGLNKTLFLVQTELFPDYLTLGMESFSIGDLQLTASSQQDVFYGPECARLNHNINDGAWIPKTSDASQFLQIDTGGIVILTGIAIQGHPLMPYRTTAFQIRITVNLNQPFESYPKGKTPQVGVQATIIIIWMQRRSEAFDTRQTDKQAGRQAG